MLGGSTRCGSTGTLFWHCAQCCTCDAMFSHDDSKLLKFMLLHKLIILSKVPHLNDWSWSSTVDVDFGKFRPKLPSYLVRLWPQGLRRVFIARGSRASGRRPRGGWGVDVPSPLGVGLGRGHRAPLQKILGLLLLKRCILARSKRLHYNNSQHATKITVDAAF